MIDIETHKIYLQMCKTFSQMSKCLKNKVATIIVFDGRIISTGINGTPKGHENCSDYFHSCDREEFLNQHSEWSIKHEIHGEMNALLFAARHGIKIPEGSILYCTHEPCDNCLKHIVGTGIKEVYYIDKYYNNILQNNFNIKIEQIKI